MNLDTLSTFAEVGIALAGFSGVVVVLGQRAIGKWKPLDRLRIQNLLEISALVVIFSLLPSVLAPLGLSDLVYLRVCNGLFAFAHALVVGLIIVRRASLVAAGDPSPRVDAVRLSIGVFVIACQVFASLPAGAAASQFIYLAALAWLLAMGGLEFAFVLLRPIREGAGSRQP